MKDEEILKKLFLNHYYRKLSHQNTINMLNSKKDGYNAIFHRIALNYPSIEACINVLTAEALLENQFTYINK